MAEYWYNNGQSAQSLGMVGYTGANRYVVVYQFTVGSSGCSNVTVNLSNFYSFHGSNQTVSCKIGTSPSQYAAGTSSPDGTGTMSYGSSWGGTISCSVNLPVGTYYAAVYVTGSAGYWSTVYSNAASISTSGSYTPSEVTPTFSSVSNPVITQNNVTLQMNNPSGISLYCEFYYSGTKLATSSAFVTQLVYTCPRSWFAQNISITSMSIQLRIYKYNGTLLDSSHSFTLNADAGMVPVPGVSSFTASRVNTGSIDAFISSLTKIRIDFARSGNNYVADMSNTAGAVVRSVWIEYNGLIINSPESGYPYRYISSAITGSGYVRIWMQDSRNRTGYFDYTFVAYQYVPPYMSNVEVGRYDGGTTPSESGDWFLVKGREEISDIPGNTRTVEVYYRETSSDVWIQQNNLSDPTGQNASAYHPPLLAAKTYMLRLIAKDAAGGSQEYVYYLSFEKWMICWTSSGDGCGIGQSPDADSQLQIPNSWEYVSGSAKLGNNRMVLVSGKHYGSSAQMSAISNPVTGQVFYVIS